MVILGHTMMQLTLQCVNSKCSVVLAFLVNISSGLATGYIMICRHLLVVVAKDCGIKWYQMQQFLPAEL